MKDEHFFDVPIYRCSQKEHTKELEKGKEKYIGLFKDAQSKTLEDKMASVFDQTKWYPWRFNEIIGWVRIYRLGGQIRGELWAIKERVSRTLKHKTFYCMGKHFEYSLDYQASTLSNDQITEIVRDQIKHGMNGSTIENRFIDWSLFENITRYYDWRRAFSKENRNKPKNQP